ncbi:MAG: hypothetical protein Q4615_15365 [Paracoccus aminovorans]|nr:hypothetical protein [Paracoccus aminovorans]
MAGRGRRLYRQPQPDRHPGPALYRPELRASGRACHGTPRARTSLGRGAEADVLPATRDSLWPFQPGCRGRGSQRAHPRDDGIFQADARSVAPGGSPDPVSYEQIWFEETGFLSTPVYQRDGLAEGASIDGPSLITQFDTTTLVPPGWTVRVDGAMNMIMERTNG